MSATDGSEIGSSCTVGSRPRFTMDFWRQLDIVNSEKLGLLHVHLIGAGGIGSPTALALVKMGLVHLTVYDDDKVEVHNLPNQMFRISDLSKTKVGALVDICYDYAGVVIETVEERITPTCSHVFSGVVISGVDSMEARAGIWKKVRMKPSISLYIDARMAGQICRIFTVNPCNMDAVREYEKTLYTDKEAVEEKCTAQAVIYNVFMTAAIIANQVKKYIGREPLFSDIITDMVNCTIITL
jgi:molybdopterin/thiamine biosynthesis adenylyltransferase